MARYKINSKGQRLEAVWPKTLAKLTHQHCSDLASVQEVEQVIGLFLEELGAKLKNLEAVFVKNFGVFSPKLLAPKKSLQHWITKERRPMPACATIRFRFEEEIISLVKTTEKIKYGENDK